MPYSNSVEVDLTHYKIYNSSSQAEIFWVIAENSSNFVKFPSYQIEQINCSFNWLARRSSGIYFMYLKQIFLQDRNSATSPTGWPTKFKNKIQTSPRFCRQFTTTTWCISSRTTVFNKTLPITNLKYHQL